MKSDILNQILPGQNSQFDPCRCDGTKNGESGPGAGSPPPAQEITVGDHLVSIHLKSEISAIQQDRTGGKSAQGLKDSSPEHDYEINKRKDRVVG